VTEGFILLLDLMGFTLVLFLAIKEDNNDA